MHTDKEAQALEVLEAERERRLNEKLERGEAIRGPVVVVGAEESIDVARKHAVAQLRKAGEKREIVFPKYETNERGEQREAFYAVITGVPRSGREPDDYTPPPSNEPPAPSIMSRRTPPPVGEPRDVESAFGRQDANKPPDKQIEGYARHVERRHVMTQ